MDVTDDGGKLNVAQHRKYCQVMCSSSSDVPGFSKVSVSLIWFVVAVRRWWCDIMELRCCVVAC